MYILSLQACLERSFSNRRLQASVTQLPPTAAETEYSQKNIKWVNYAEWRNRVGSF